ncbi:hypothetical protein MJD09_07735 [bacterium]|nr:hypothetical protein [bacterium]
MYSKSETEIKFENYRQALSGECMRLISTIRLYVHINKRMSDRAEEINTSAAFFFYVLSAFFTTIVVWTNNLLNPSDGSGRNLIQYLSFIENNREIFSMRNYQLRKGVPDDYWALKQHKPVTYKMIEADRKQISNFAALKSIELRRNKFHAHFNKEYFIDREKISGDAPLKWSDLNEIIRLLDEIFNRYSGAYDGSIQKF